MPVCATTVAAVASRSVRLRVPPVDSTALVSLRLAVALVSVETSSLPVMLTVTVALPPSVVATVKLSLAVWPALRLFKALLVV